MTRTYLAKWRSSKAEQRYRELDAKLWQRGLSGPAPTALDVPTSFGSTRVYRWPGNGSPVVFLHGMGDTSVRWIPFAEQLGGHDGHDVYAIDLMGDVGASVPTVGFASAADYADWLGEVVHGLGIGEPTMVGESLGGYVALLYAMANPVAATVLFEPVGVVKLRMAGFMAMGAWGLVGSLAPRSVRHGIARRFHQPLLFDKDGLRLFTAGQRGHPPKLVPLPVFTDDQMASITAPVRALVGGKSSVFDGDALVARVNAIPGGRAQVIPNAGHALTASHFGECLDAVRSALAVTRAA